MKGAHGEEAKKLAKVDNVLFAATEEVNIQKPK